MSKFPDVRIALALGAALGIAGFAQAQDAQLPELASFDLSGIGQTATPEEIAGWDIDVRPDGEGLPVGRGTANEGEEIFVQQCAVCHGDFGEGAARWPQLAGGEGSLDSHDPVKTVGSYWPYASTLVDYINRAMPYGFGQSLSPDELFAVSAYVLFLGNVIEDDFELSNETLAGIVMPNHGNFFDDDRETAEAHFWTAEPCMSDCAEGTAEIQNRAAALDVTPEEGTAPRVE